MNIQQSVKFTFIFAINLKNLYNFDHLRGSNLKKISFWHWKDHDIKNRNSTAVVEIGQPQKTVKKMIDLLNKA